MKLRFFITSCAAVYLSAGMAHADSFSGPYVGAGAGYERFGALDIDGVSYGVIAGYNHLLAHNLMIGLEAGIADSTAASTKRTSNAAFNTEVRNSVGASYGLSGRIGIVAKDRNLIYARAGWGRIRINSIRTRTPVLPAQDPTPVVNDFGFRHDSLVLGTGFERRIGKKMSIRLSYDYGEHFDQHRLGIGILSRF